MSKVRKRKPVRWKRMSVFDVQPSFSTPFLDHKIYVHGKSENFSSTIVKLLFPNLCHTFHLRNYEFHLHLFWINMLITLVSMCVTELLREKENAFFNPPYFLNIYGSSLTEIKTENSWKCWLMCRGLKWDQKIYFTVIYIQLSYIYFWVFR